MSLPLLLTPVLALCLFLYLAFLAGQRSDAAGSSGPSRPGAMKGMLRSLLGSAVGLILGAVPFLVLHRTAGTEGPTVAFIAWFFLGPAFCLIGLPVVFMWRTPLPPRPPRQAARGGGSRQGLIIGGAAALAAVLAVATGGTPGEAVAAMLFPPALWLGWKIYGRLMRPG